MALCVLGDTGYILRGWVVGICIVGHVWVGRGAYTKEIAELKQIQRKREFYGILFHGIGKRKGLCVLLFSFIILLLSSFILANETNRSAKPLSIRGTDSRQFFCNNSKKTAAKSITVKSGFVDGDPRPRSLLFRAHMASSLVDYDFHNDASSMFRAHTDIIVPTVGGAF